MLTNSDQNVKCLTYFCYLLGICFISIVAGLSLDYGLEPIKVSNRYLTDDSIVINNATLTVESLPVSIYMANRWVAGLTVSQFILCCAVVGVLFYTVFTEPSKLIVGFAVLIGSVVGFVASVIGAGTLARLGDAGRAQIISADPELISALEGWQPLLVMSVVPGSLAVVSVCYTALTSKLDSF